MFFNRKKRIKVPGQIIKYELLNEKHYPVFVFNTLDGKRIESRNKIKDNSIEEAALEDVYTDSGVIEKLNIPLPDNDVIIKYLEEDPTDFIAIWI